VRRAAWLGPGEWAADLPGQRRAAGGPGAGRTGPSAGPVPRLR